MKLVFLNKKRADDKVLVVRIRRLAPCAHVPDELLVAVVDPVTDLVKTVHISEIVVVPRNKCVETIKGSELNLAT